MPTRCFVVPFLARALTPACIGIDYNNLSTYNDMLEVEWCAGELGEEEYEQCPCQDAELRPARGGRVFYPRYAGTGYKRDCPE